MPSYEGRDRHVRDVTARAFPSTLQYPQVPSSVYTHTVDPLGAVVTLPPSPPLTPDSSPSSPSPIKSALKSASHQTKHTGRAPLTPRSSSESLPLAQSAGTRHRPGGDQTFLSTVFPASSHVLTECTPQTVGALPLPSLKAALVDAPNGLRTLYVSGLHTAAAGEDLRDAVVELLDLADERIEADELVCVLDKSAEGFRELVQGLLYVGGSIVRGAGENKGFALVGIEI